MARKDKEFNNSNQLKGLEGFNLTPKQKQVNNLLRKYPLVFVLGSSGTGKTSGILHHFCKEYINDKQKKIIIIRTPVEAGPDKIGSLPGEKEEKLGPHFSSVEAQMREFLGGKFDCDLGKRIHFTIPNYILGATIKNSFVLMDEAQQFSPQIMKLLLERLGENTVCAVVGDPTQIYANGKVSRNGIIDAQEKLFTKEEYNGEIYWIPKSDLIERFEYEWSDNVRSDISKEIVRLYT